MLQEILNYKALEKIKKENSRTYKDWNGKVYIKGYKDKTEIHKTYEPIVNIKGSKVKLIGFKEN